MDSISQIALGASVTLAVMGRRTAPWKSVAVGAAVGTLPDLDVLIDYGDAVLNMVQHRADSHALFWMSLLGPPLGAALAHLFGERGQWRRWALAVWLAFVTHPLLDLMTIYGTQLLRPFSDHPFGIGSVFVIDPLFTLPLLAGIGGALASGRLRANGVGLAVATAYLAWGFAVQQHVTATARAVLQAQGVAAQHLLVTPTAFNSLLWRIVAVGDDEYREGYYGILDAPGADGRPEIDFRSFSRGTPLAAQWGAHPAVARVAAFSHGFYKLEVRDGRVRLIDLRMGVEPFYSFDFDLGPAGEVPVAPGPVQREGRRPPLGEWLPWLWRRMWGEKLAPPQ